MLHVQETINLHWAAALTNHYKNYTIKQEGNYMLLIADLRQGLLAARKMLVETGDSL